MPFDKAKAEKAIAFIRNLGHTKGKWAGVPFELMPWQRDKIIKPLFGTVKKDQTRQYRTCYVEIPRKNGKSEIAAAIALYLLFADGEMGAEIYSAAADREQANLVFNVAAQMVRMKPQLADRCKIIDSQKRIVVHKTASVYRAISAEAYTKHGLNAHGIIFDELHAQPNRDLWDVLTTSGGTRTQPLTFAITTAGFDRNSICWEQHEYGRKILDKIIQDPTFLPVIYSAPEEADWTNKKVWRKCNPALGAFRDIEEMISFCEKAKETPTLENTFRRLYLNQWTQQETRWLSLAKWDACAGEKIKPDDLIGRSCYGGLDLASTTDIAALVLVFPGEPNIVLPYFWIPEEGMRDRSRRDRVPYDMWCRAGLIEATPGNVIDYGAIIHTLQKVRAKYQLQELAFDRWGSALIVSQLQEHCDFAIDPKEAKTYNKPLLVQFGQGFASMSSPTKELLNLVLKQAIRHGGNPVLRWMADNLVVKQDPAGNVKPDKSKSTEKIDGMVALVMAMDRAIKHGENKSIYEKRGVLAF